MIKLNNQLEIKKDIIGVGIVLVILALITIIIIFITNYKPVKEEHELKDNEYKVISNSQKLTFIEEESDVTKKYDKYFGKGTPLFDSNLDYEYFFDYSKERTFNIGIIGTIKSKNTIVLSSKNVTPISEDTYLVNKDNKTEEAILINKINNDNNAFDFKNIYAYINNKASKTTAFYIGLEDNKVKLWTPEDTVSVTLKIETTTKEDLGKYFEYNLNLTSNPIYISINENQEFVKLENDKTEITPKQYRVEFKYDYLETRYVNPGEKLKEPPKTYTDDLGYKYTREEEWYIESTKEPWDFKKGEVNNNLTLRAKYDSTYVGKDS